MTVFFAAIGLGIVYILVAIWGFILGDGESILAPLLFGEVGGNARVSARAGEDGETARFASARPRTWLGEDAITVIRWKDIHEHLEEAVDACENAADVLEAILVKNR